MGDIDRGGVFAQLYGTLALLEDDVRARVKGTIIKSSGGDRSILEPVIKTLEELCGVRCRRCTLHLRRIDDEDSLTERFGRAYGRKLIDIAVYAAAYI